MFLTVNTRRLATLPGMVFAEPNTKNPVPYKKKKYWVKLSLPWSDIIKNSLLLSTTIILDIHVQTEICIYLTDIIYTHTTLI